MSIAVVVIAIIVICIYAIFILAAAFFARPVQSIVSLSKNLQVSVLIPCRNEARNIEACLQSLQRQAYDVSCLEIILIDDASSDNTVELAEKYNNVIPLRIIKSHAPGKKNALLSGIQAARFPVIVTLDADCWMGTNWLATMAVEFTSKDLNMLCGPVNLDGRKGLFNALQQAESAAIVGISAMMLNKGKPATCNGANLMFRKGVFEQTGGYHEHIALASGDDDLLMQRFYRHDPLSVKYTLSREAMVFSCTSETLGEFFHQRLRWISKGKAYIYPYNRWMQTLVFLHLLAFYMMLWASLCGNSYAMFAITLKYVADILYGLRLKRVFNLHVPVIILMPFFQLYILVLLLAAPFIKPEWKKKENLIGKWIRIDE